VINRYYMPIFILNMIHIVENCNATVKRKSEEEEHRGYIQCDQKVAP